ncbi:MAG: hypothetical protein GY788_32450 [bacterium]|nr:hypothetical protein [bacterium]
MRKIWLIAICAVAASVLTASPKAEAIDPEGSPSNLIQWSYDTMYTVPQAMKDRTANAAYQWTWAAPGTLQHLSSANSKVGFRAQTATGLSTQGCGNNNCTLWLNLTMYYCDDWYWGTGPNPGTSYSGQWWCQDGTKRIDAYGSLVHELGHWRGAHHDIFGATRGCQDNPPLTYYGTLYAPLPTQEASSMCYSESWPEFEGGTGSAGIAPRRSISQDEIQTSTEQLYGHFVADPTFQVCPGCGWDDDLRYRMFTPNSNHYWQSGLVSLNNNASVPYPEVRQRVRGDDVDVNGNGRFRIVAEVKARPDPGDPQTTWRAIVFVRHVHGTTIDHEFKCPSTASSYLTPNVLEEIDCYVDAPSSAIEFEYGVRVTNKVNIYSVKVYDD